MEILSQNKNKIKNLGTFTGTPSTKECLGPLSYETQASTSGVTSPINTGPSGSGVGGKPLTKTQKRNRRRILAKKREQAALSTSGTSSGVKRTLTELSTPSLASKAVSAKRPRKEPLRSYRQVASGIKMAVIKQEFPIDQLSGTEKISLQKEIIRCTDNLSFEVPPPHISNSGLNKGAFIVECDDEYTVEWLTSTFHSNDKVISGTQLKVIKASELLRPVKMAFKHRDRHTTNPQILLMRLKKFNPGLNTDHWRVLKRYLGDKSARWIFEVDPESAIAIREADFTANSGLCVGHFKILSKSTEAFAKTSSSDNHAAAAASVPETEVKETSPDNSSGEQSMLHGSNGPPIGLLPTPDVTQGPPVSNSQIPPLINEVSHAFPSAVSSTPVPSNSPANVPRTTVIPPTRPSLLGDRPPAIVPPPIPGLGNQFPERADPRIMSDHDLRTTPVIDPDMRPLPMMASDKDMRHPPMGDQDFRSLNAPPMLPENRPFNDPRYRNVPGPDMGPNRGPPYDRPRPGLPPDGRTGFDGRSGVSMSPRLEDPRSANVPPGRMASQQNPRMAPGNSASPAVGGASPSAVSSPRPGSNPLAAAAAAIAPHDQEKAALIMQVLQLTDQQIAMLPPEQRQSIMILKEQIARSQQAS